MLSWAFLNLLMCVVVLNTEPRERKAAAFSQHDFGGQDGSRV